MTLARALRLLLAVALLAAWQGALLHPLEHADSHGNLVHAGGAHSHSADPQEGGSGATAACDAIAALTACIPDAASPVLGGTRAHGRIAALAQDAPAGATRPPYQSQAPPALA